MPVIILVLLPALAIAGPYNRADWPHWSDLDGDCQDSRAETLIRDSVGDLVLAGCRVVSGRWIGPYTGEIFTDASDLDIDHIVPLKEAHVSGGEHWAGEKKRAFANDPDNLLATKASANRAKGSKGPSEWLPDLNRCEYAARWLLVKSKYGLAIDSAERLALIEVVLGC